MWTYQTCATTRGYSVLSLFIEMVLGVPYGSGGALMRRRRFLFLLGSAVAAWPLVVRRNCLAAGR